MSKNGLLNDIQMPKTRRLVLLAVKEHGRLTVDELADMLKISNVAVRRHLDNLRKDDLIEYEEEQQGIGRPSYVYFLTEKADHLFPRNYQDLATDMISTIRELYGQEAVEAIFKDRFEKIGRIYKPFVNAGTLQGRVQQLVELRQADGYMATWDTSDDAEFVVTELNCPIQHVAEECERACHEDLGLFSSLLDADVIRLHHKMEGDNMCAYKIKPKPAE